MDKFLIGPVKGGLKTDLVPFFTPEDAFTIIRNLLVKDGKIRRSPMARSLFPADIHGISTRLGINIGVTDAAGVLVPTVVPTGGPQIEGQQFFDGASILSSYAGTINLLSTGAANGTYDVATGTVAINNAVPNSIVYWYPCYAVLGFATFTDNNGNVTEIAFDNKFAYRWLNPLWLRITNGVAADQIWSVDTLFNNRRYISYQYRAVAATESYVYVTNDKDPIRYYDSTLDGFIDAGISFSATPNNIVIRCKFIIGFQQRLLLLNTVEYEGVVAEIEHPNRIRFSEYGDTLLADSWYQAPAVTNKGGFVDLPKGEVLVCAEILGERLIVFTESSIYELITTGNNREPFAFVTVDQTFGSGSTSVVEIDNRLLFVNNSGIYVYDGRNVIKISEDLGDLFVEDNYLYGTVFKDVYNELIYISIERDVAGIISANQNIIIVYNYKNNTFSYFDNVITAFGELYNAAGERLKVPRVFVGNQSGYTFYLELSSSKNAPSGHISHILRLDANHLLLHVYNHNLTTDSVIRIENSVLPGLNGNYRIVVVPLFNWLAVENDVTNAALYTGDGIILTIPTTILQTKEFNFYMKDGFGTSIDKISFNINKTDPNGGSTLFAMPNGAIEVGIPNFYLGNRTIETLADPLKPEEVDQARVWREVYLSSTGETMAIQINNDAILLDDESGMQEFTINAIIIYAEPAKSI